MDTQTIDLDVDLDSIPAVVGVEYDHNGRPVGITLDEWMGLLDEKLIAHYGEDFRQMLNDARAERGLLPR